MSVALMRGRTGGRFFGTGVLRAAHPQIGAFAPAGRSLDMEESGYHEPVLVTEVLAHLGEIALGGSVLDLTVGGGGHAARLLQAREDLNLVGMDRDPDALAASADRLAPFGDRVRLLSGNYHDLAEVLEQAGVLGPYAGVLMDLGVSSAQLDRADRGFSFQQDGPLDMRMNPDDAGTAADLVNEASEADLKRWIREFGEEPKAGAIARAIVKHRESSAITRTAVLAELVRGAYGPMAAKSRKHPATRTFQALRIVVNDELAPLEPSLRAAFELLAPGGRLAVITFHSLEDRIVKRCFVDLTRGCRCEPTLPLCVCGKTAAAKKVTRRVVTAQSAECDENPRARSAKLRVIEKVREAL